MRAATYTVNTRQHTTTNKTSIAVATNHNHNHNNHQTSTTPNINQATVQYNTNKQQYRQNYIRRKKQGRKKALGCDIILQARWRAATSVADAKRPNKLDVVVEGNFTVGWADKRRAVGLGGSSENAWCRTVHGLYKAICFTRWLRLPCRRSLTAPGTRGLRALMLFRGTPCRG